MRKHFVVRYDEHGLPVAIARGRYDLLHLVPSSRTQAFAEHVAAALSDFVMKNFTVEARTLLLGEEEDS